MQDSIANLYFEIILHQRYTQDMNMFKPTDATTPQEYIEKISEPRNTEVKKLYEFIRDVIPDQKPHILYGMIGFGTYHYKYASGREGEWSVVCLASQKNYISIYICATDGKQYIAEKYKDLLPKANIGKSCIRIKKIDDINLKALKKIILEGMELSRTNFAM